MLDTVRATACKSTLQSSDRVVRVKMHRLLQGLNRD